MPTYHLAKRLNSLLTPYVPNDYNVASSTEFLSKLKGFPTIVSLDVESLQTLIEICTKKASFTTHKGHMYIHKDGVVMGSPLGMLFYMEVVEERVFPQIHCADMYLKKIDDTFVMATSTQDIDTLRRTFEECSCLRFTVEHSKDGRLPFLDVLISPNPTGFDTSVYIKPINLRLCLKGDSECPTRDKAPTIRAYICRAPFHCSTWPATNQELDRVAQVLVNNGYSNRQVSHEINLAMDI
ncbi:uncharacterized protein [Palaemon carinicauda]|uniref:uncharacterized protein n=1 Tax=Palaemon carinicauda TaxID=392227 RepID=UPI0035B62F5A